MLVDAARDAGVDVQVIPGPSACVTALVASGIPCDHFFFEGFIGRKHGERVRRLRELAAVPAALILYESPHRAVATLEAIAEVFPTRRVAFALSQDSERDPEQALAEDIAQALDAGEPASAIAKCLSQKYSLKKRAVYERVLTMQDERSS